MIQGKTHLRPMGKALCEEMKPYIEKEYDIKTEIIELKAGYSTPMWVLITDDYVPDSIWGWMSGFIAGRQSGENNPDLYEN